MKGHRDAHCKKSIDSRKQFGKEYGKPKKKEDAMGIATPIEISSLSKSLKEKGIRTCERKGVLG